MDLQKLIHDRGLRFSFVAEKLFPKNKHPYNALNRVISKGRELTASQLLALADLLGMSADAVLDVPAWSGRVTETGLAFSKGPYLLSHVFGASFILLYKNGKQVQSFDFDTSKPVSAILRNIEDTLKNIN